MAEAALHSAKMDTAVARREASTRSYRPGTDQGEYFDRTRRNNVQPAAPAAELGTGCSGHIFGSTPCNLSSMKNRPPALESMNSRRPRSVDGGASRKSSCSSSSACPNEGSASSDSTEASDQRISGAWGDSDAIPWRSRRRSAGKNIAKSSSAAEHLSSGRKNNLKGSISADRLKSGSRHVGKSLGKGSSYRIETEYLPSSATHASFCLDNSSTVILTQLPEKIKDGIRTVLLKAWGEGIQKEGTCHDVERYFFKLKKRPFSSGNVYAVTRMSRNIIAYLACESWIVQPVASLLSPYDTLNFRKCSKPLPKCYWLAIAYGYAGQWQLRDQLNVLGGSDELIDTIRLTMQEMDLVSRLRKERVAGENNWHQFYMKGSFHRTGSWARKKILFLRLMERLEERGWVVYASYHRVHHENSNLERNVGTWVCVKSHEWTPTNPVKLSWKD
ncbi:hypothetical protein DSL72_006540 [Monilinia vaccinii-corymbosi]|uniref:Uncharacterized protein n=1 Tax=Monilinia vaccinii-corymbosi TaxID=61207 RepID=A0A8A3PP21_9HELO|nr:hypothetical protein DSL72_006540 [Monilinia vaccinii-corymbosi]